MPTPTPHPAGTTLRRRTALAAIAGAAGAALVGGCTSQPGARSARKPAPGGAPADPDVAVAAEALASQRQMLRLVSDTGKRHRRLAARLASVADTHQAHADLLADAAPKGFSPSPSAAPGAPTRGRLVVPRSRARALARVVEAEQQLAAVTQRQAFRAESGAFARILASMAAAAAQNAAVLSSPAAGATA